MRVCVAALAVKMNNTYPPPLPPLSAPPPDLVEADVLCPEPTIVLSYRMQQIVTAVSLMGIVTLFGLLSALFVLLSLVRKLNALVATLQTETGSETGVCVKLLNLSATKGLAEGIEKTDGRNLSATAAGKKKTKNAKSPTTSCAEEEDDDE